jgi:hypothetical protein
MRNNKSEKSKLETPVLFLIFNRPDKTERVFKEIKKAKPKQLFIASDGARKDRQGEDEIVKKTREIVLGMIDWECEVETLFRKKNLGCGKAVSESIDWFFENVEEGIILEDDCLPSQSFFWYCQELLERYRKDERIMHIGGHNHFGESTNVDSSYFFSKYVSIWGWSTWQRAWKKYEFKIDNLNKNDFESMYGNRVEATIRKDTLKKVIENKIDTWDYQWDYCVRKNNGLSIKPQKNLVRNIGLGNDSTHTNSKKISSNVNREIEYPLKHPYSFNTNKKEDDRYFNKFSIKKIYLFFKLSLLNMIFFKNKQ